MKLKFAINILLTLFLLSNLYAADEIVLSKQFFRKFSYVHSLKRDEFLHKISQRIVIGKGYINTVLERNRYKKKYRISIKSSNSGKVEFIYHIYLNNKNTIDLLSENAFFEFKGQIVGFTAINTNRSKYIIDIIFMDGSTIINGENK